MYIEGKQNGHLSYFGFAFFFNLAHSEKYNYIFPSWLKYYGDIKFLNGRKEPLASSRFCTYSTAQPRRRGLPPPPPWNIKGVLFLNILIHPLQRPNHPH